MGVEGKDVCNRGPVGRRVCVRQWWRSGGVAQAEGQRARTWSRLAGSVCTSKP